MTAKEAREKAEATELLTGTLQYSAVMKKIDAAITKGEFKATIYTRLIEGVKTRLQNDGYRINEHIATEIHDDDSTTVSW